MVFKPTKPAAPDDLDVSQGDIQGNFQTSNTVMAVNHFEFDITTGQEGMHKKVDLPILAAPPTTGASIGTLYTSTGATGSPATAQLIYRKESQAGAYANDSKDIPLSLLAPRVLLVYNVGTASIVGYSYNVSGVANGGVGIFTVTFPALASVNYIPFISLGVNEAVASTNLWTCRVNYNTITTSSCELIFTRRASSSNALTNPDFFSFSIYGGFT